MRMADRTGRKTSPALIAAAWLVVGLPWLWGIFHTLENAAKLFQ
jgi:hypothetical protein